MERSTSVKYRGDHGWNHAPASATFWLKLGSLAPRVANSMLASQAVGPIAKRALGVDPDTEPPHFADQTFHRCVRNRSIRNRGARRVVLWPGVYNDHFYPQAAYAALDVLEAAGFHVVIPRTSLSCGCAAFQRGHVAQGKRQLRHLIRSLRQEARDGVPIIALESACIDRFRHELVTTMPENHDARLIADQTSLLADFLDREEIVLPPRVDWIVKLPNAG